MANAQRLSGPIVLIEDDLNDELIVRWTLSATGIENPVIAFDSVLDAQGQLADLTERGECPLLFIIDITLRGSESGIDFLRWLRSQSRPLGTTPAMMLSGSEDPDARIETAELAAVLFLSKPVTAAALVGSLRFFGVEVGGPDRRLSRPD